MEETLKALNMWAKRAQLLIITRQLRHLVSHSSYLKMNYWPLDIHKFSHKNAQELMILPHSTRQVLINETNNWTETNRTHPYMDCELVALDKGDNKLAEKGFQAQPSTTDNLDIYI